LPVGWDEEDAAALYKWVILAAIQEAQVDDPTQRTVDPVSI